MNFTPKGLVDRFSIKKGDTVVLGSDLIRVVYLFRKHKIKFSADLLIDLILERLGEEGTLLIPTFSWEFRKGQPYDYKNSPPVTGAVSKVALKRREFKRTLHPIHSFAVAGKCQREFTELKNKSSFGSDSPFALMRDLNAKMCIIGLDYQRSFTFIHFVEESVGVWYRDIKEYQSVYIDELGRSEMRTYKFYTPKPRVALTVNRIGRVLEEKGASISDVFESIPLIEVDLRRAFDVISEDILQNRCRNMAYRIPLLTVFKEKMMTSLKGEARRILNRAGMAKT